MRLIDADDLKSWFGLKDLYTYDYIVGVIDDAPTIEPKIKLVADIKLTEEAIRETANKAVAKIEEELWGEEDA